MCARLSEVLPQAPCVLCVHAHASKFILVARGMGGGKREEGSCHVKPPTARTIGQSSAGMAIDIVIKSVVWDDGTGCSGICIVEGGKSVVV